MKRKLLLLAGALAWGGLMMTSSSCVVAGGRVYAGGAIAYGPYHFWLYDGPWLSPWPWWRGSIHVPPPLHFGGPRAWPHIPDRPRVHRGR